MKKYIILIIASIILISGCEEKTSPKTEYKIISAQEAYEMMTSAKETEEIIILDVRNTEEYAESRIDGSINVPLMSIEEKIEKTIPNKEATILVYCKSGVRAELASQKLIQLGYSKVYDFGGIDNWTFGLVNLTE